MENCSCRVRCDVDKCKHNDGRCGCKLSSINITTGATEDAHFCGSYECGCGCGGCEGGNCR